MTEALVEQEAKVRTALDLAPIETPWMPTPEDQTDEQKQEFIKAEKAKQAENLKKLKKKPKTEEEDLKDAEELVSRTTSTLVT